MVINIDSSCGRKTFTFYSSTMFQLTAFHDNFVCDEKCETNIFAQAAVILEKCPANTHARDENLLQNSFGGILVEFYAADFYTAQLLTLENSK